MTGPYDLVQLAALLRRGQITSETPTFAEGEMEWRPFGDRAQFIVAKEMPKDAVFGHRQIAIDEEASAGKSIIPLPSKERWIQLGVWAVVFLISYAVVYGVARADAVTGICLFYLAGSAALVAQVFIYCKILDEDWMTIALIAFVPLYDLYYFASNLDKYLPLFAMKYGGITLAFAAHAGAEACGRFPAIGRYQVAAKRRRTVTCSHAGALLWRDGGTRT